MCITERHFSAWQIVHLSKLALFLCQHIWLGNICKYNIFQMTQIVVPENGHPQSKEGLLEFQRVGGGWGGRGWMS